MKKSRKLGGVLSTASTLALFAGSINYVLADLETTTDSVHSSHNPTHFYERGFSPDNFSSVKRGALNSGDSIVSMGYLGSLEIRYNSGNGVTSPKNTLYLGGINANRRTEDGVDHAAAQLTNVNLYADLAVRTVTQKGTPTGLFFNREPGNVLWLAGSPSGADYSGINSIHGSNLDFEIRIDSSNSPVGEPTPSMPIALNADISGFANSSGTTISGFAQATLNVVTDLNAMHPRSSLMPHVIIGSSDNPATFKVGDINREVAPEGQGAYDYTYVLWSQSPYVDFKHPDSTIHYINRVPDLNRNNGILLNTSTAYLGGQKDLHGNIILEGDAREALFILGNSDIGRSRESRAKSLKLIGKNNIIINGGVSFFVKDMEYHALGADRELIMESTIEAGEGGIFKANGLPGYIRFNGDSRIENVDLGGNNQQVEIGKLANQTYIHTGTNITVNARNAKFYGIIHADMESNSKVASDIHIANNSWFIGGARNISTIRGGDAGDRVFLDGTFQVADLMFSSTGVIRLQDGARIEKTLGNDGARINAAYQDDVETLPGRSNLELMGNNIVKGGVGALQDLTQINIYKLDGREGRSEIHGDAYADLIYVRNADAEIYFPENTYIKANNRLEFIEDGVMTFGDNVIIDGLLRSNRANQGTVNFEGSATLTDRIGDSTGRDLESVNLLGAGSVSVAGRVHTYNLNFKHKDAEFIVGERLYLDENLTAPVGGGGTLRLNDFTDMDGLVGTENAPLDTLYIANSGSAQRAIFYDDSYINNIIVEGDLTDLRFTNSLISKQILFTSREQILRAFHENQERVKANFVSAVDGYGTINANRNGGVFEGNFGSKDASLYGVYNTVGINTFKGDVYAYHIGAGSGDTLIFEGDVYAQELHSSGGSNRGNIIFKKNATITGSAGVQNLDVFYQVSRSNLISIVADGALGDIVSIAGDVRSIFLDIHESEMHLGGNIVVSSGIRFKHATEGVLKIENNIGNRVLDIVVAEGGPATGTILVDKSIGASSVTFPGRVGSADNMLKKLKIDAPFSEMIFNDDTYVQNLEVNGASLYLNEANGLFRFGNVIIENDRTTGITLNQNSTFLSPKGSGTTNLGTEGGNILMHIDFENNRILRLQDGVNILADHVITNNAGAAWGQIFMEGNSTFSAPTSLATGDRLFSMDVNGQLSDVSRLLGKHSFSEDIRVGTSTFEIDSSIAARRIHGLSANSGGFRTVAKNGAILVDAPVGLSGSRTFASVEAAGQYDTYYKQRVDFRAGNQFIFKGDRNTRVIFEGASSNIGGADFSNQTIIDISSEESPVSTIVLPPVVTNFTGDVGGKSFGNNILNFELGPNADASFATSNMSNVTFSTSSQGTGRLDLSMTSPMVFTEIGSINMKFEAIRFSTSGHEVTHSIHAKDIIVGAGTTTTFGGMVSTDNNMQMTSSTSTAIFKDGIDLHSVVTAAVASAGILEFKGNATIRKNIGDSSRPLGQVKFINDGTKTNLLRAGAMHAREVVFTNTKVILDANVNSVGDVLVEGTKLNLNDKKLIIAGDLSMVDTDLTFTILDDLDAKFMGGQITSNGLTLGGTITLNIEDAISNRVEGNTYDIIINSGSFNDTSTIVINDAYDPSSEWKVVASSSGLQLTLDSVTETPAIPGSGEGQQGAKGDEGATGATGAVGIQGFPGDQGVAGIKGNQGPQGVQGKKGAPGAPGAQGAQGATGAQGVPGNTGEIGATGDKGADGIAGVQGKTGIQGIEGEQGDQGPQGVQGIKGATGAPGANGVTIPGAVTTGSGNSLTTAPSTPLTTNSATIANNAVLDDLEGSQGAAAIQGSGNLASESFDFQTFVMEGNEMISGVGAGGSTEETKYGAWASPFYRQLIQKQYKEDTGFEAQTIGANIGIDFRSNEDMIMGGALAFSTKNIKHRDEKKGDKTKVTSYLVSMYALNQITDKIFTDVIATVGVHNVDISDIRVNPLTNVQENVKAKFEAMSFGFEGLIGCKHVVKNVTIIPTLGLRFSRVGSTSYEEEDTTLSNIVQNEAMNSLSAIADLRLATKSFKFVGLDITPSIHGGVMHDLIAKTPRQEVSSTAVKSQGVKGRKIIRTEFTVGADINAECGMMEYGVGYDLNIAKKRIGHSGTIAVRVNF